MKTIPLTQGQCARVDDDLHPLLSSYRWYAAKNHNVWYAVRKEPVTLPDGRKRQTILFMHHAVVGKPERGYVTDHIDHDGLNNQRENLRNVTIQVNAQNTRARGVTWDKERSKWKAQIMKNYKQINLGRFLNLQEAISARRAAEQKYFNV